MKKVLKRSLSLLLAITIIFGSAYVGLSEVDFDGLFAVRAKAASSGTCGADLTWTLDGTKLTISGTGDMFNYNSVFYSPWAKKNVESVIINQGVTSIGSEAFRGCTTLTSIRIPDSLISIGNHAFYACTKLAFIDIPDTVTSIGNWTFAYCSSLTSITIPESVTSINDMAFGYCENLTSITLPNNITTIEEFAFSRCSNLVSIIIPDSVISIGDNAFLLCKKLASVTIPASVTDIGQDVFDSCESLEFINVDENNPNYSSIDGVLFNNDKTKLIRYPEGKVNTNYIVPDSVTSIADRGFVNCSNIKSVTIPYSVLHIGETAFITCTNLVSIDVDEKNNTYMSINGILFSKDKTKIIKYPEGNTSTTYTIPDSVTTVGPYAFYRCDYLVSIDIPDSVLVIDENSFRMCDITSITIPDSVTSIGEGAFEYCESLTTITIPDSVTSIGSHAFAHCVNLTTITIPDSVTNIGSYAFFDCVKLVSFIFPSGITKISNATFRGCKSLSWVYIPSRVSGISANVFKDCLMLEKVCFGGTEEQWNKIVIGSGNEYLLAANIIFYGGKYNINSQELPAGEISFDLYDKKAWIEGSENSLYTGEINPVIENATINYDGTETKLSSNSFTIDVSESSHDIFISAEGFQNYIIPSSVVESFKVNSIDKFSVYMNEDHTNGETYISSVFARNVGDSGTAVYRDITTENLNILNGIKTDIIVSAVEQGSPIKKYYIHQDGKIGIPSTDGKFSAVDLYSVFDEDKPISVYAVLESGKVIEQVSVSLKKQIMSSDAAMFLNACEAKSISLFGKDGCKVQLSDSFPLLGGASFTTGLGICPVGIEMENDFIRISIGADIVKIKEQLPDREKTYIWKEYKNLCKGITKYTEELDEKMASFQFMMNRYRYGSPYNFPEKKANFDFSICAYIEAYIVDGEIVIQDCGGGAALELFYNYKRQFLVQGIPAIYAYVKAGEDISIELKRARAVPDVDFPLEWEVNATLAPSVRIGGGIGVKDAISAGFWGKATAPLSYNFSDTHFTLGLKGEMGLEAEFFMLKSDFPLLKEPAEKTLIDTYFNSSKKPLSGQSDALYSENVVDVFKDGEISLVDFSYLENTSEWLGGQNVSAYGLRRTITPESVKIEDLQYNVYKNSQTQIVKFGDTMLMAWIEGRKENDGYNVMRLVYSVYDTEKGDGNEKGGWSEPKPVADNGTCDAAPSLATDGKNVYIAWQNIDYTVSTDDEATVGTIMENAEIRIAKYNPQTKSFENIKTITDNSTYDYAPKVTVNNGVAEVYWVNGSSLDFAKGTLSLLKSDFNGVTSTVLSGLNYIHSVDSNGADVSYTMDVDGNNSTTNDVKVFTNSEQVSVDYDDSEFTSLYATYAMLAGEKTLFYADDSNICYIQDGKEKVVFDSPRNINGNLQICSDGKKTIAMWLEAGEIGNELYTCTYENGEWTSPVQLTDFSEVLSNVALTYFEGKIYGVFNRTNLEEATSEVDGSTYYKNGTTDLCQLTTEGFTDISLSLMEVDESRFVSGEDTVFNVCVKNNGTEKINNVTFVITDGNGYSKTIEKAVELISGESKDVELTYTVPEAVCPTELSVYASLEGDVNEEDNTVSEKIGNVDLSIGDLQVRFVEGAYIVTGIVTNKNIVAANNVKVYAYIGEINSDNLVEETIASIEANGKYSVDFVIDSEILDFNEKSFYDVTIDVAIDSNEKITHNNKSVGYITEPNAHTHYAGDWIVDKEATCVEDGSRHQECVVCEEVLNTEVVTATGHDYSTEWTIDQDATCTENGSKSHHCTGCDDKKDVTVVKATGHTAVKDAAVAPTCTTAGITEGSHCSVCNTVIKSQTTVPAKGHTESEWIIDTQATASAPGAKHKECTECGKVLETATIPQLKPTTPKVTTTNEIGGVQVKWNEVEGATKYNVYRRQGGYNTWTLVGTTTGNSLLDKNVKSGIYYVYSVRAYNSAGQYSDFVTTNTQTRKFMATPKLTTIYNHANGLAIKWNAVAGVTNGYRVYRRGAGSTYWTYLGTTKNLYFIDSQVKAKSGEYFRYTVIADGGYHSKFDTTGLYLRRLANPTLTSVVSSSAGITVKWGAVKGTTGYYVYRKTANSTWVRVGTVGGTNTTTFLDKTTKKGTTYTYTVRAVYGATTSAYNSGISCYDKY